MDEATASEGWRVTVSSKPAGTRFWGALCVALGMMMMIAAGGTVLTDWRDWPGAAFFLVVAGLFGAGGVHFLRRAGKPVFEFDSTGLTYYPLDDISWKPERIPWDRVQGVRFGVPTRRRQICVPSITKNCRPGLVHAYDFVAGEAPDDPGPLAHTALPLMLSSIPEDELLQVLQHLSERHGFALELARSPAATRTPYLGVAS